MPQMSPMSWLLICFMFFTLSLKLSVMTPSMNPPMEQKTSPVKQLKWKW